MSAREAAVYLAYQPLRSQETQKWTVVIELQIIQQHGEAEAPPKNCTDSNMPTPLVVHSPVHSCIASVSVSDDSGHSPKTGLFATLTATPDEGMASQDSATPLNIHNTDHRFGKIRNFLQPIGQNLRRLLGLGNYRTRASDSIIGGADGGSDLLIGVFSATQLSLTVMQM